MFFNNLYLTYIKSLQYIFLQKNPKNSNPNKALGCAAILRLTISLFSMAFVNIFLN